MGVLACCMCGDGAGWSLYVREGRLCFRYDWGDAAYYEVRSEDSVPAGSVDLKLELGTDEDVPGSPTHVVLHINDNISGAGWISRQPGFRIAILDVGADYLTPAWRGYPRARPGFPFSGRIRRVTSEFGGMMRDITPRGSDEAAWPAAGRRGIDVGRH
jgi:hypothetical protein